MKMFVNKKYTISYRQALDIKNIRSFGNLSNALLKRRFHIVSYK